MEAGAISYVSGVSTVRLLGDTIGQHFDRVVARDGDRLALVSRQQGIRWSWRELAERSNAFPAHEHVGRIGPVLLILE